jgi:hypothetical protein
MTAIQRIRGSQYLSNRPDTAEKNNEAAAKATGKTVARSYDASWFSAVVMLVILGMGAGFIFMDGFLVSNVPSVQE